MHLERRGGGVEGWRREWHLLAGHQTAALKHAELISFVSAHLSPLRSTVSPLTAELQTQLGYLH